MPVEVYENIIYKSFRNITVRSPLHHRPSFCYLNNRGVLARKLHVEWSTP